MGLLVAGQIAITVSCSTASAEMAYEEASKTQHLSHYLDTGKPVLSSPLNTETLNKEATTSFFFIIFGAVHPRTELWQLKPKLCYFGAGKYH